MQDAPAALEIIDAVIERLSTVVAPVLEGRLKFEVRVAERALQLARRELALAPELEVQERARLWSLTGGEVETLADANRRLCADIEEGDPALDPAALLRHLRQTTLEKLTVDQPDYPPLRLEAQD